MRHLSGLKENGFISSWDDRKILPGQEWDNVIKRKLETAEIVLFLVSSSFIASDYIKDVEIKRTIERYERDEVIIVPIILRPCDFSSLPISRYRALPKDAKPISKWNDRDEALLDVVKGLKKLINTINVN
ncbi:MAG: toll/interleukin-1 receptor domain-containing protein [Bacteroidota bacterium]